MNKIKQIVGYKSGEGPYPLEEIRKVRKTLIADYGDPDKFSYFSEYDEGFDQNLSDSESYDDYRINQMNEEQYHINSEDELQSDRYSDPRSQQPQHMSETFDKESRESQSDKIPFDQSDEYHFSSHQSTQVFRKEDQSSSNWLEQRRQSNNDQNSVDISYNSDKTDLESSHNQTYRTDNSDPSLSLKSLYRPAATTYTSRDSNFNPASGRGSDYDDLKSYNQNKLNNRKKFKVDKSEISVVSPTDVKDYPINRRDLSTVQTGSVDDNFSNEVLYRQHLDDSNNFPLPTYSKNELSSVERDTLSGASNARSTNDSYHFLNKKTKLDFGNKNLETNATVQYSFRERSIKCDLCDFIVSSDCYQGMRKHLGEMGHYSASLLADRDIDGSFKSAVIKDNFVLNHDARFRNIVSICPECFYIFPTIYMVALHYTVIHNAKIQDCYGLGKIVQDIEFTLPTIKYICERCPGTKKFKKQKDMLQHWKKDPSHYPFPRPGPNCSITFICTYCKRGPYHEWYDYRPHMYKTHNYQGTNQRMFCRAIYVHKPSVEQKQLLPRIPMTEEEKLKADCNNLRAIAHGGYRCYPQPMHKATVQATNVLEVKLNWDKTKVT